MNEIVVLSGKGGTGKTSITASLAIIAGDSIITADCDVDAADMHLLMKPDFMVKTAFYGLKKAEIKQDICTQCGKCADICRFDAITFDKANHRIQELHCEGCGYCQLICPEGAIHMKNTKAGMCYLSTIKTGGIMVHARLGIAADNSGKLVAEVKKEAKEQAQKHDKNIILVDGPPGIGCPVISSLSGASLIILVTESSLSGLHDLKRAIELLSTFKLPALGIINKADINPEQTNQIKEFFKMKNIPLLAEIPFDKKFTEAMVERKTIMETEHEARKKQLSDIWKKIIQNLNN